MRRPLRFATFLAPNIFPVYQAIADYVGEQLGVAVELAVGTSFDDFAADRIDVGFICGLPYVQLMRQNPPPVDLIAAPTVQGRRYQGRPIYFSDVVVPKDSDVQRFGDLRGCTWAYNDPDSHSGYNVVRHRLVEIGRPHDFFGRVVQSGFHQRSLRMVIAGEADATAIDSQVLAVELRDHPELAAQIRLVDSIGPSTIQPVVASHRLSPELQADIRSALLAIGDDPIARQRLDLGLFQRFATISDSDYDNIRRMLAAVEKVGMPSW